MNVTQRIALFSAGAIGLALPLAVVESAHAVAGPVVISEIHYHPGTDLDTDDFLELTNTGSDPVDMSGWSFTAGITLTLPPGSVVAGGGRFVVSRDATRFAQLYGFAPGAVYSGNLSNGGETVTIVDASLAVVDTVTYADQPPWPVTPDGTGPSLELRGLTSDNTDPDNWGASLVTGGTPGAVNTLNGTAPPPQVKQLSVTPLRPDPGQAVTISAKLPVGASATLTYKVMFGAEQQIPFLDDAASPGGAGDGMFAASLPGQAAGNLVRYRIDATSGGIGFSAPTSTDSVFYNGYTVLNPGAATALPTIEYFMSDAVYNDLLANHRFDDVTGPATIAYNGLVIDGAAMRVKGQSTRSAAKVSWKVELPSGHDLSFPGVPYPVDEFNLQRDPEPNAMLAWSTIRQAGGRYFSVDRIRIQRNGQFWSVGGFLQDDDGDWRDFNDVDDWAIYKGDLGALAKTTSPAVLQSRAWLDKKTREDEDYSDVWQLSQVVDAPSSAAQHRWIANNVNIPELINYMALNSLIRNTDSIHHNWFIARDTEGTGRWEMWQWDLDVTFLNVSTDKFGEFLTPDGVNRLLRSVLAYPEYRQMYFRRLKTLIDQFLINESYESQFDAIINTYKPDLVLENAAWGLGSYDQYRRQFQRALADRREVFANETGPGLPIPRSQSPAPRIVINELNYHPVNGDAEYLELTNPTSQAVDLSGWTIDGVGLTIQPGTVILPEGRIVFVANDGVFRATYGPDTAVVGGQYSGHLSDDGEQITLLQGARVVDQVAYGVASPWPDAANGGGRSLELRDPALDNADPASWAASVNAGSPGLVNSATAPTDTQAPTAPGTLTADGVRAGVSLTWGPASDDRSVDTYQVLRDGAVVATLDAEYLSYVDRGVSANSAHVYSVRARDRAGNTGPPGNSAPAVTGSVIALAYDDFSLPDGSNWSNDWATEDLTSGVEDVVGGAGRLVIGPGSGQFARAKLIGVDRGAASQALFSYTWGPGTPKSAFTLWLRASGGWSAAAKPVNGYGLTFASNSASASLLRASRSAQANLRTVAGVQSLTPGQKQWVRLRVVGTTIQFKLWRDGTAEPSAWAATVSDSAVTAIGRPYLVATGSPNAPKALFVDDFTLTAGG